MAEASQGSSRNLFICCTPLQAMVAGRIITEKRLAREDCIVFFYSSFDNAKYRHAYQQLRALCGEGTFYVWRPNFPRYILDAKRFFRQHEWQTLYAASIDSVFVHLAMSVGRRRNLYTFDDGTANIAPSSNYRCDIRAAWSRRVAFWLFGNRYDSRRIKRESLLHYTIYRGLENIIPRLEYISLFGARAQTPGSGHCTVVIGTVLREVLPAQLVRDAATRMANHIDGIDGDVFYIPHPRGIDGTTGKAQVLESEEIAEVVIGRMLQKYGEIDLLGFGSTAQLNMASSECIRNQFFTWPGEPSWMAEVREIEQRITRRPVRLLPLLA